MVRDRLSIGILLPVLALLSGGCERPSPAAPAGLTADELAARTKALEDLVPDQAHIMADVADHFANLWFAGEAENWPLADFYLNETAVAPPLGRARIPVRKDNQGTTSSWPASWRPSRTASSAAQGDHRRQGQGRVREGSTGRA